MWHFTEQGQGRPLVLLHGIGMSGAACPGRHGGRCWRGWRSSGG